MEISDSNGNRVAYGTPERGRWFDQNGVLELRQQVPPDTYTVTVGYDGKLQGTIATSLSITYPVEEPEEPVDTTAPTTVITEPTGGVVGGQVDIGVSANDASGVEKVEFYVDSVLLDTDTTSSYRAVWDTTQYANGAHNIMVKAYDTAGNIGRASAVVTVDNQTDTPTPSNSGIWISQDEIKQLPTSGQAWERVHSYAYGTWDSRWITDQESNITQHVLAGALVSVALNDNDLANKTRAELDAMVNEWDPNERSLGISRNLAGAVVAADILDYRPAAFTAWVQKMLNHNFSGRTIISTHQDRPNNWGTHAGTSRIAAEIYLNGEPSENAVNVHRGWLGDYSAWPNFEADFGITSSDISWQSDPTKPVGINPSGATIGGRNVDGVAPDDQRRAGWFDAASWPPPAEDYVYNALAPAAVTTEILARQGYASWSWSSNAMRRAVTWLNNEGDFPVTEAIWDGSWIAVYMVNRAYGTSFPVPTDNSHSTRNRPGNAVDFVDWTHQ